MKEVTKRKILKWLTAAGVRALKTFAQTAVATIGGNAVGIVQIDWVGVLSISATAAVVSMLTSIAGLPELKDDEDFLE